MILATTHVTLVLVFIVFPGEVNHIRRIVLACERDPWSNSVDFHHDMGDLFPDQQDPSMKNYNYKNRIPQIDRTVAKLQNMEEASSNHHS